MPAAERRYEGGAVTVGGWFDQGVELVVEDSTFEDNSAGVGGGGGLQTSSLPPDVDIHLVGDTFRRNTQHALSLGDTTKLSAVGCDMGAGADDNTPADALTAAGPFSGLGPDFSL